MQSKQTAAEGLDLKWLGHPWLGDTGNTHSTLGLMLLLTALCKVEGPGVNALNFNFLWKKTTLY